MSDKITVHASIKADLEKVWDYYTKPEFINQWNFASPDWECKDAKNDLRVGGNFSSVMSAKDGSGAFEFGGVYTQVVPHELIGYTMGDGRTVTVSFAKSDAGVEVKVLFDPENINSPEMQQSGWQAILDNFKDFVEKG